MIRWKQIEIARKLRKKGWTYVEIQEKVPVHKNTICTWCSDIVLTKKQISSRGKLYANGLKGAKANQLKRKKEVDKIRKIARNEAGHLDGYLFKIAGAILYWAEGDKTNGVGVSNSDPKLIRFMVEWYKKICKVPMNKLRPYLYLHTGQDEANLKEYWGKLLSIPLENFGRTTWKEEGSSSKKIPEYKGTIRVRIFDENLKHRILGWVEQLGHNLGR